MMDDMVYVLVPRWWAKDILVVSVEGSPCSICGETITLAQMNGAMFTGQRKGGWWAHGDCFRKAGGVEVK